jgi:integrase/recombinase XerD
MQALFEQFVKERRFLNNSTEKTIQFYRQSWAAFCRCFPILPDHLSNNHLTKFVMHMRESGLSPVSCNVYIRGMNSFLSWLHEHEYVAEPFRMRQLKVEQKILQTFNDQQVKALLSWKPKTIAEHRLFALLSLLADTGIRIEEALTLKRDKVDFDNLLLSVKGKGNKERIVPMSMVLRKTLFRYVSKHSFSLLFPTRDGGRLSYHNCLRDFKLLAKRLGIEGVRVSFHTLRHGFALNYVRSGGSLFHLQKALGHTTLTMTRRYCELSEDDLKQMHTKTSLLNRLK